MKKFLRRIIGLFGWLFSIGFTLSIIGAAVGVLMFNHYSQDLPDHSQLAKYDPETLTRLYAANGKLLAEYATEKRVFVPISAIPKSVINAFLSAEDKNFYTHTGVDFTGLVRAIRDNVKNYGKGRSLVGGSTITQQVVKNFLLTNEKSFVRKIKEAILAMRISQVYSKDKILELYLNEIYLGLGSYGVAAAAQNYFNKSLDDLTIEEVALLAAQPKAPADYNPRRNYDSAKVRRDLVIERMLEDTHITDEQSKIAKNTPIVLRDREATDIARADFFAEEVRRTLSSMYGSDALYGGGLVVKTTLNPQLQKAADMALQKTLIDYDHRHGYRGALAHLNNKEEWQPKLIKLTEKYKYQLLENQKLAVVSSLNGKEAQIIFDDGSGVLPFSLMKWAQKTIVNEKNRTKNTKLADILKVGDVVVVSHLPEKEDKTLNTKKTSKSKKTKDLAESQEEWSLAQIPKINGAMVVLDPHTGRVLAMSGGYTYGGTEFNRATQAKRQPGSLFKPFVYMAGLENGFTPSDTIMDEPVEVSQGEGRPMWRPSNYHGGYLGPITMRVGLEKSRNTVTVRIAEMIGLDKILDIGKRFNIYDNPAANFSIVLGATETTLLRLVNAYGMIVNGGKKISPSLIERIDDRHGKIIYRRDERICSDCKVTEAEFANPNIAPPELPNVRKRVADQRVMYQITSMLRGVASRGTAARSNQIGKIVAGKTGTTNGSLDTWFIGFTPDLVAGVFVGYDKPHTLGRSETGSSVALPAFIDFMKEALADVPNKPFRVPRGIQLVKVDLNTGLPLDETLSEDAKIIEEAFVVGAPIFVPKGDNSDADESESDIVVNPPDYYDTKPSQPIGGTSGLY
ncbi:MAG: penicillin-binding protein 1A [Rickettsiales bacterium]|jgi:penicillin-binding protein 1A